MIGGWLAYLLTPDSPPGKHLYGRPRLEPTGYAVTVDGRTFRFDELAARLPWRHNSMAPHEPRMPAHEYVVVNKLEGEVLAACRLLEFLIDKHRESYDAFFRGYRTATRYLEPGDGQRYWRSRMRVAFVNRCRFDSSEPPRRVDEGGKPIPASEWGARYPSWPQDSGYGDWSQEDGRWVYHDPPKPTKR